jgi:cation transport regulator ChaB
MAAWRQALALVIVDEELAQLTTIARSRTEPASRVERAHIPLAYRDEAVLFRRGPSLGAASSNRAALRRERSGPWSVGGAGPSPQTREGSQDHRRSQKLAGLAYPTDIFREAFNHAYAAHAGGARQEEAAHRIAWGTVKRSYVKTPVGWRRRESASTI